MPPIPGTVCQQQFSANTRIRVLQRQTFPQSHAARPIPGTRVLNITSGYAAPRVRTRVRKFWSHLYPGTRLPGGTPGTRVPGHQKPAQAQDWHVS
eukprot:549196-Rhodomonas_salina.1